VNALFFRIEAGRSAANDKSAGTPLNACKRRGQPTSAGLVRPSLVWFWRLPLGAAEYVRAWRPRGLELADWIALVWRRQSLPHGRMRPDFRSRASRMARIS
jgi:hypothetical protein